MTDNNTGDFNTGNRNTGDWNTGNCNTGNCNTGYWNTGNRNAGDWNTGNWNTGNLNTGKWNTGNWNTGYCNTITPDECLIFNKKGSRKEWINSKKPNWMYVNLTQWVFQKDMSEEEKGTHPSYKTTGGYLKSYDTLQDAYKDAWEKATPEDRALTFKLPNFDPVVFEEIFGFNPQEEVKKTITIDGKDIEISLDSYNELKKSLTE